MQPNDGNWIKHQKKSIWMSQWVQVLCQQCMLSSSSSSSFSSSSSSSSVDVDVTCLSSGEKPQPPLLRWLFGINKSLWKSSSPIHSMKPGLPAPPPPTNQNKESHALVAAHWLSLGDGEWDNELPLLRAVLFLNALSIREVNFGWTPETRSVFVSEPVTSNCSSSVANVISVPLPQVSSRLRAVRVLRLHRVRQLADSFRLWQYPWPRSFPSTSGLSLLHVVCCCCCLRLPPALQLSGWGTQWANVSNPGKQDHHVPSSLPED